eukprot:101230-Amphidinium_carterae.2
MEMPPDTISALQMRQGAIGMAIEARKPTAQRLAEALRQARLATQTKTRAMQQFATLQEQLSSASVHLQEAQAAETTLAVVQRIKNELAEHTTQEATPPPASQQAILESFLTHTPSLAQLDEPTQELLRLAVSHGYNCARHGSAIPALPPTELRLPTPALIHTLTQSPALSIHSARNTDIVPNAGACGAAAILAAHQEAGEALDQQHQATAFATHLQAQQVQACTALPPPQAPP